MFFLLMALWICFILDSANGLVECHHAYDDDCYLSSITDNATDNTHIECYGYHSCSNAIKIEADNDVTVRCWGTFGCYKANEIRVFDTSGTGTGWMWCPGLFSCSHVPIIYSERYYGRINCVGEQSCSKSTIVNIGSNALLNVYGFRAIESSNITVTSTIYLAASFAAQNATLRADNFDFDGNNAAYDTHLICDNNCYVYCSGSACNNIGSFNCIDGNSSSCNYIINCNSALKSDACPNGYILPPEYELPNFVDIEFSTIENSLITCNKSITNATNCDDYGECLSTTLLTTSNGPICCTAYESCGLSTNIISKVHLINNNINIHNTSFRADGYHSASYIRDTISSPHGGHMYFTSYYAGRGSTAVNIENNGEYDIIVTGFRALEDRVNIKNARNVYCLARLSCYQSSISNINNNVFGYAHSSLHYSMITDIVGNIYCDGSSACRTANFINVLGNIIAVGDHVLSHSDFHAVGGVVLGYGDEALRSSDIINTTTVIAQGNQSLYDARIEQISRLEVNGFESLNNAIIITDVQMGNNFTAIINGSNTQSYDIYCTAPNICKIVCVSTDGCKLMNLHCHGTCYVECDEDINTNCPIIHMYTPTSIPSNMPTLPTVNPSKMPSDIPSIVPSNYPSNTPSSMPSNIPTTPTISPSEMPSGVPSSIPSDYPSVTPSSFPSNIPTLPTMDPSKIPTNEPSVSPSNFPTNPTQIPSYVPSRIPSDDPTHQTTFSTTNYNIASNKDTELSGDLLLMFVIICIIGSVILLLVCLLIVFLYAKNAKDSKNEMKEVFQNMEQKQAQLALNKIKSASNDNIGNDTEIKLEMTGNSNMVTSIYLSEKCPTNGKHISSNENISNQVSSGENEDKSDNPDCIESDKEETETQGQFTPQK